MKVLRFGRMATLTQMQLNTEYHYLANPRFTSDSQQHINLINVLDLIPEAGKEFELICALFVEL
jgi:hypothetical protein